MRRRFFWGTTAVAGFVLFVVGAGLILLIETLTVQATREEMARQAQVIELMVNQQFQLARAEGVALDRLEELFASGGADDRLAETRTSFALFLRSLLEAARELAGGTRVDLVLLHPDGRLTPFADTPPELDLDAALLHAGKGQWVSLENGQALIHPFTPFQGRVLDSTVLLILARETPVVDWGPIVRPLLLTLLAAVFLAAMLARLLSRWLVRRLDRVSEAAGRLAEGETDVRAPEGGSDEVSDLSRSFNEMADRMAESRAREQEFLMSVGHDLRTPLTTIGGYAEVLEDPPSDAGELRRIGTVLSSETARLRRLVEDLMLLARLEAHEFTLELEPVDAAAHLAEVTDGFRPRADTARVRLDVNIEPTGLVTVDPDRLGQIAGNLLENALRYTPEAGWVRLDARRSNGRLEMVVRDSGPGIDAADLPHAFEKFYVARRYRRIRPEGSGLGLSIVRRLAEAMGGTVAVASELGEGTAVSVSLPAG
ncbi:MAG: ATP-binding protein [Acidimicrobiia bacterium]